MTPEIFLILLYKRHEIEIHKIRISAVENSPIEKPNLTYEKDLFPNLKDFLSKLNISLTAQEFNEIYTLENNYNSQFDTGDDE